MSVRDLNEVFLTVGFSKTLVAPLFESKDHTDASCLAFATETMWLSVGSCVTLSA